MLSCIRCEFTQPIEASWHGYPAGLKSFSATARELGWVIETLHLPSGEVISRDRCPNCSAPLGGSESKPAASAAAETPQLCRSEGTLEPPDETAPIPADAGDNSTNVGAAAWRDDTDRHNPGDARVRVGEAEAGRMRASKAKQAGAGPASAHSPIPEPHDPRAVSAETGSTPLHTPNPPDSSPALMAPPDSCHRKE